MDIPTLQLVTRGDERGRLLVVEGERNTPFAIKRVYYIYGTSPDLPRGFHAHHALVQMAVCIKGSCRVLLDDGREKASIMLDKPETGLIIDKLIWHEMHDFTPDCVLVMHASEYYDESDYIRDYDSFKATVKAK